MYAATSTLKGNGLYFYSFSLPAGGSTGAPGGSGRPGQAGARFPEAGSAPRPVAPSAVGDWPMYGHDAQRTNYNPDETTINSGNVAQLVQRWQVNIGGTGLSSSAP